MGLHVRWRPRPARGSIARTLAAGLGALAVCAAVPFAAHAQPAEGAAGPETFGDWQVRCGPPGQPCVVRHEQTRPSGERLLVVEIAQDADGMARGTALLPFGVLFDEGLTLQIDEGARAEPLPFRTCVPSGCVVTFDLGPELVAGMRGGTMLSGHIATIDGQNLALQVSLRGFTAATDRLSALARDAGR